MTNKIDSDKIFIKDAFEWWYSVPDYQRPYVWGTDQVHDLLDDISQWLFARPDSEYFIGSIVLQERRHMDFTEYDLLDGQQRLSTCLMTFAVGRDLSKDPILKETCNKAIFQKANPYDETPERLRIVYDIRDDVRVFINRYIKPDNGTNDETGLKEALKSQDIYYSAR